MNIDQALQTALAHHRAGQLAQAESIYRQVLQRDPRNADALHLLGLLATQTGHMPLGVDLIRQAIALAPGIAHYHSNLGKSLCALGRPNDAIASLREALRLRPDDAETWVNLGALLRLQRQPADAAAACRKALALRPTPETWYNLANALHDLQDVGEASQAFNQALALRPNFAEAHTNYANLLLSQGKLAEACAHHRRAIELRPHDSQTHGNLLAALHFDPACDDGQLIREHERWAQRHAAPLARPPVLPAHAAGRKLRIGYVSPCFRFHVVGLLIEPLLRQHNRDEFEVFCYSDHPQPDAVTGRLIQCADRWRQTTALNDEQLARQVTDDRIDLLVDLNQHMANNRMLVFARKPAPMQAAYLGYAATTGLPAMDCRLTDVHMDPPGTTAPGPEKLIRLPDCYWCYPGPAGAPDVAPLPADTAGHVTFGSMNAFSKINPAVIAAWAAILRTVRRSRLRLLIEGGRPGNEHVLQAFESHGVAPDRIDLLRRENYEAYLAAYHTIDIALDPFPYNGGVTSMDAMWMGVPIVTLAGDRSVGRAGVSLLMNVGLPELIAQTAEEYVTTAATLAGDLPRLRSLRAALRDRLRASPLMDAPRFARNVEAAYRLMCHGQTTGRSP